MKKFFRKYTAWLLALVLVISCVSMMVSPTQAEAYTGIMHQNVYPWTAYYFNGGSMAATGCGIFSLANAVGYLTGQKLDVLEVATWAHNDGTYNVTGADGTYRTGFYPRASARYGPTYGFTIDCGSDTYGYWSGAYDVRLKNHLINGGTAVVHVYNHFMTLVGYDPSTNKFHLYDCAPRDRRNTLANNGDLWFTEAQLSSGYTDIDWFCLVSSTVKDEENPVISDVQYSNVSASGYTISCTVTDNSSVSKVAFPTWTVANGQDDLPANFTNTQLGSANGNRYTFRVNTADHNNEKGEYVTHIYAFDRAGNQSIYYLNPVEVRDDRQGPQITDVRYFELSSKGYSVSCKVTDDWGVSSVAFPSWTTKNGQDDLPAQFMTTQLGAKSGDRYVFRVNISDHNNETGEYVTHIYATDCAGNQVNLALDPITLMDDRQNPVISDVQITDVTEAGYTVSCKVTDNWGINSVVFPTWTEEGGQDDIAQDFFHTQMGQQDGDTYTFRVNTADHNDEQGLYHTHIYATDCADNRVSVELMISVGSGIRLSESAEYEVEEGFVSGVTDRTSVNMLLAQFDNSNLEIRDHRGRVLSGSDLVGTGATVNLMSNNQVMETVTVVVLGDVDGNGIVNTTDYIRVKGIFWGLVTPSEAQAKAADVDGSAKINSTDYLRIKSYFLGTYDLY